MRLVDVVNKSPLTHELIKRLRLRSLANAALGRVPIVRRLPRTGVRYRYKYIDSITLADDLFGRRIYDPAIPESARTFADLGCNVGQFVALLAERTGRRDISGLAVDADPAMIEETSWVVQNNGLHGVHPILGLVGSGVAGEKADFFLHPVRIKSSRFAVPEPGQPDKGEFERIQIPYIDLEALWRGALGDARCDLLKIDIEGGETDLIQPDNPFFRRVDRIVLEIHKWVVAPEVIHERLVAMGFEKVATLDDTIALEVSSYARR
jgi:FkbM family methyltransferase